MGCWGCFRDYCDANVLLDRFSLSIARHARLTTVRDSERSCAPEEKARHWDLGRWLNNCRPARGMAGNSLEAMLAEEGQWSGIVNCLRMYAAR